MKISASISLAALIALGVPGCGNGSSPIPFESYCDAYVDFACSTARRCDCLDGFTEELCRTALRPDCVEDVEDPVNSGDFAWDASEGGKCLDGLKAVARDCSTVGDDEPEACKRMLLGQLAEGQTCDDDDACQGDLYCHQDECGYLPGDGEACLEFSSCSYDTYCGQDELCHTYPGRGETCGGEVYCGDDLYCSGLSQTCQPYPGQGGDCEDSQGGCEDGLYCDQDDTCQAQKPAGTVCTDYRECLSYECEDGFCLEDSICDEW